jgi:endogenous inhibitor of DNA gyrase (YacG/DUF329 family)
MNPITVTYTCPECEREFDVLAYPVIPARLGGPPEMCHPAEGGEIEPEECPGCGREIDTGDISDLVADATERCDRDDD